MMNVMVMVLLLGILVCIDGYASSLTCSRALTTTSRIMGTNCKMDNSRTVQIKDANGRSLSSGDSYVPGQRLTVSLSSTAGGNYVLQTTIGSFQSGSCNGKRILSSPSTLVAPTAGSGTMTVMAGFASGYGAVSLTNNFVLYEGTQSTIAPSYSPTSPTHTPTAPTYSPSIKPTATVAPTYKLGDPTPAPTTSSPSFKPTITPSMLPTTSSPVSSPYDVSYTIITLLTNVTAINIDSSMVTNALNSALITILSSLAAPSSVQVTSTTIISHTNTPTSAPATNHDQDGYRFTREHDALPQLDRTHRSTVITRTLQTHLTASPCLQVEYSVVYNLQSTSYSTSSALLTSISSTLDYGIVQTTTYLTLLRASKVFQLQGISSTSLTSVAQSSSSDDTSSNDDAYDGSTSIKAIVGLVVGGVSVAIIIVLFIVFFATKDDDLIESTLKSIANYPMWIAVLTGVVAIGLVSGWAQDNNNKHSDDTHYLGKPSQSNVFAWHPILMVCFFFCQVQALVNWSFFSNQLVAKIAHVFAHIVGVVLVILGLIAAVRYNYDRKSPSLNTMHGWVGVCAITIFGSNFAWGSAMALITAINPSSKIRKHLPLLILHRIIGSCAMILSAAAILTGIMDKLPYGSCFYLLSSSSSSSGEEESRRDIDPAENYSYLPGSCKIAHGLGIAIIIACMFSIIGVIARSYSDHAYQSVTPTVPLYDEPNHEV